MKIIGKTNGGFIIEATEYELARMNGCHGSVKADADNKAALDALDNVAHYVGFTSWNVTEEKNKDVFRALKTIRAALQGAAMSQKVDEWQHISTAPKDGSDTIIYCETSGEMFIAFYAEQITTGQKDWVIARANDGTCFILKDPTHWMPLPPQPKGGDDD